jgi:hypothetical protein
MVSDIPFITFGPNEKGGRGGVLRGGDWARGRGREIENRKWKIEKSMEREQLCYLSLTLST